MLIIRVNFGWEVKYNEFMLRHIFDQIASLKNNKKMTYQKTETSYYNVL